MKVKKAFAILQKIGKSLMLPVSVLPAAGILLRLGQPDLLGQYGEIFEYLSTAGDAIFINLPLIFAVGAAIGFSDGEAVAALAAVVGELIFEAVIRKYSLISGYTIHIGVFGGIIIGLTAGILYKKYYNIKLPKVFGFFSGKRFVPIITSIVSLIFAIIGIFSWPTVQRGIDMFAHWASSSILGPAFYAAGKRILIPLGLHHVYYPVFLFQFGEYISNGVTYFGDSARYFHGDPTAGIFMAAEYPILMFGLPGAAAAIIAAAKPENRKKISGMIISAAFVSFLTGITEPIEFSFIFAAPVLFLFHAAAAFLSGIITSIFNIRLGYTFSASFIDYILGYKFAQHPLLLWIVGAVFFVLYFSVFYISIKIFNFKTPGREEDNEEYIFSNLKELSKPEKIINAVGGKNNIENVDACITRLRIQLKDSGSIDKKALKAAGAVGTLKAGNCVQIIFGTDAESIKDEINYVINNVHTSNSSVIEILNPIEGEIIPLEQVPDEVFSNKILGEGFAIRVTDNKVFSPVSGEIAVLFPTKHAVVIRSCEGIEVLVHVGMDTVNLRGEGFTTFIKEGDVVKKGDMLLSFDELILNSKAFSTITPVIITNKPKTSKIKVIYGYKKKQEPAVEIEI